MVADNVDEALHSVNKLLKEANKTVTNLSSIVAYVPHATYGFLILLTIMILACIVFVAFQYYVGYRVYDRHKQNNPVRSRHLTQEKGLLIEDERSKC